MPGREVELLIDDYLPRYDARERHICAIHAPAERVYAALRTTDLASSAVVRALLWLRAVPGRLVASPGAHVRRENRRVGSLTLDRALAGGFILLAEEPGRELLLGAAGRFWRATGELLRIDATAFRNWSVRGSARAAWNFGLEPSASDATRLSTETRVLCDDAASRRRFRLYWLAVRPFSGLIRREMLRAMKRMVEGQS